MKTTTFILLLTLILNTSLVFAEDEIEFRTLYQIGNIQVKEPTSQTYTLLKGKIEGNVGRGSCGDITQMLASAGIQFNSQELQRLVENWQGMALPVALYFLATSLPVVKEVIVGARTLSQFIAQLGGSSCEGIMRAIDRMNVSDSKIVQQCMANKLSSMNPNSVSDTIINQVYNECMSNAGLGNMLATIVGPNNLGKAKEFLSYLDPQSYARCFLHNQGAQILDPNNASYSQLSHLSFNDRVANLSVLLLPTLNLQGNIDNIHFGTIKLDGKDVSLLEYLQRYKDEIKKDVEDFLIFLEGFDFSQPEAEQALQNKLNSIGEKYNIDIRSFTYFLEIFKEFGKYCNSSASALNTGRAACCAMYLTAKEKLINRIRYDAVNAVYKAFQIQGANMINSARVAASTASKYGCGTEEGKIDENTIKMMELSYQNAMDILKDELEKYKADADNACKDIAQKMQACLQDDEGNIITHNDGVATLWLIGDNCEVVKTTLSGTVTPENLPPEQAKYENPVDKVIKIGKKRFGLIALVLLMISLLLFGKTVVTAIIQERYKDAFLVGSVMLLIIAIMYKFISQVQ